MKRRTAMRALFVFPSFLPDCFLVPTYRIAQIGIKGFLHLSDNPHGREVAIVVLDIHQQRQTDIPEVKKACLGLGFRKGLSDALLNFVGRR